MYQIQVEQHFDAAHFLAGYVGKCSNLHGHRWRVLVEAGAPELIESGQNRGMVEDFSCLKRDLKKITETLDHHLIYEAGSLQARTVAALEAENFCLVEVPFRPTAEHFAKEIFDRLQTAGHEIRMVKVYETPENCAIYRPTAKEVLL